jgi:F-type H+-transporting ATPase subunit b
MNLFLDPKFWLSVSFLSFLALLIKLALPFIIAKIDSRLKEVLDSVKLAEKSLKESEILLADAERLYKNAVKSSQNLIQDANKESEALIIRSKKLVQAEIDKKILAVRNRIKKEEEKLIRELKNKIITSAVNVIEDDNLKLKGDAEEELVVDSIDNFSAKIH